VRQDVTLNGTTHTPLTTQHSPLTSHLLNFKNTSVHFKPILFLTSMRRFFRLPAIVFAVITAVAAQAQPVERFVKVVVGPDHSNWTYKTGEKATFSISVLQNGNPLKDVRIRYEIGPEKMTPLKKDSAVLAKGTLSIDGGTLRSPGFLRCIVTAEVGGKQYRGLATAGFEPLSIAPTVENPDDFTQFWNQAKEEAAKIPMDARMTLLPDRCTEKVNVYHVSLQNFRRGTRVYGILCVPKKEGKYPALLTVPGAGVRPYGGDIRRAEMGMITLEIGIHGIPVTMDPGGYTDLGASALNGYQFYNMDSRDR
jgi:hypothetical protein